jgi:transcriptional regulator with XRE-family HTH domain
VVETTIGLRVTEVRGDLSQSAFGTIIGVHKNTVGRIERGEYTPDGELLQALHREFAISPTWVLTGEGEKYCRPAEMTGAAIALAIRDSGLSIDEVVGRLGCGIDLLLAWLEGRKAPEAEDIKKITEITGTPLHKLQAAREVNDTLGQIDVVHAQITAGPNTAESKAGMTADEATLLARFSQADDKGKAVLLKISAAIANPSMKSWFDAGIALSDAATILDKKH